MKTVVGIDPGARYTGVVIRQGDKIISSSTYVRPVDNPPVDWAMQVAQRVRDEVLDIYPDILVGVEGISDPRGHYGGKKAPINPKDIIRAGMVLLAVVSEAHRTHRVVIVPPKKNGSGVNYPTELMGRRPADLPGNAKGAGTRDHERSAYDVAGEIELLVANNYVLDVRAPLEEKDSPSTTNKKEN